LHLAFHPSTFVQLPQFPCSNFVEAPRACNGTGCEPKESPSAKAQKDHLQVAEAAVVPALAAVVPALAAVAMVQVAHLRHPHLCQYLLSLQPGTNFCCCRTGPEFFRRNEGQPLHHL
jgi:hypothetical protein